MVPFKSSQTPGTNISMNPDARKVFTDFRYLLAYGLGSGLAPRAPGTAGSLAALLLFFPLQALGNPTYLAVVLLALIVGVVVSGQVARELELNDPGGIVIDEFVGLWIALFMLPGPWYWALGGFGLFRLFDIAKPWPVGWLDRRLKGGLGIMMDDVAAGIYALAVLQAIAFGVAKWWP